MHLSKLITVKIAKFQLKHSLQNQKSMLYTNYTSSTELIIMNNFFEQNSIVTYTAISLVSLVLTLSFHSIITITSSFT